MNGKDKFNNFIMSNKSHNLGTTHFFLIPEFQSSITLPNRVFIFELKRPERLECNILKRITYV